jgi:cathepsin B
MFSRVVLALALSASAQATSDRQKMVDEINSKEGLTWKAGLSDKFGDVPLHSSTHLYGAKSFDSVKMANAIANGELEIAPIVSAEVAATIPDSFDSATNWPECAKTINDIRDQSNCGCCWAFGAASAASDRACIATGGENKPFSAQDVCFNAENSGCNGGSLFTPWSFIKSDGVVTGGQYLDDIAKDQGLEPSDPFDGEGYCASFSLPHCFHHGPENTSPYPAEGDEGCPSVTRSPAGPTACDDSSNITDYQSDKYSFDGRTTAFPSSEATIQNAIMTDGPVEAAFTVYSDFENYVSGIYSHTTGSYEGGHAIRIVGWGEEDGTKYWKVANSWNPYWGEEGYFRIVRGEDECGIESQVYASSSGSKWSKMN